MPSTLAGRIALPTGTGWQLVDGPRAAFASHATGGVFRSSGVTVYERVGASSLDETMVLASAVRGPRMLRWRLTSRAGTPARAHVDSRGRVRVGDSVVFSAPVLVDRHGRASRQPRWRVRAGVAELRIDDRELAFPVALTRHVTFPALAGLIDCTRTASPAAAAQLTTTQRLQVRAYGAYRSPGSTASTSTRWTCVRTTQQSRATRRLTDALGPARGSSTLVQRGVALPERLDQPLTIDLPGRDEAGWTMLGAPVARARVHAQGAVYATGAFDVTQHVQVGAIKESIVVHRRQGVRTWRWRLRWDGGIAPQLRPDGSVRYGAGVVVAPPFVQDAAGRHLRDLAWELDGDVLSVSVDDRALALPYVIDPASSYPQRIHPIQNYVTGSTAVQGLIPPPLGTADTSSGTPAEATGDWFIWSGNTTGYSTGASVNNANAPLPRNLNGIGACAGVTYCYGALGWAQEALGGATLAAGPYTVQSQIAYNATNNTSLPVVAALKARMWKVKFDPADTDILAGSPVPITNWATGPPQTWTTRNSSKLLTVSLSPLSAAARALAPTDHLYIEYVMVITDAGRNNSTFTMSIRDVDTFIDFGGPATNTPGTAADQRLATGPLTATGWTTDATPTLRADLDDPDWAHHLEFQVCADAACTSVVRTGTTPANQVIGSTTDAWTVPAGAPLPDGTYFVRARTQEDGGDSQTGAWNTFTGATCAAVGVGPCGRFSVDATAPTGAIAAAPATPQRGTIAVTGTAGDNLSGVAARTLQWRRLTPAASAPSSSGIACTGALAPTWSCTWNTTAAGDGTYELLLTVTDAAGNVSTSTQQTWTVDNTAPAWPGGAAVLDGAGPGDLTWALSPTSLAATWAAAADAGGVIGYEVCISTGASCGGTVVSGWTGGTATPSRTTSPLPLAEGQRYVTCVRAVDAAGNSSTVLCSDGQTVDTQPPSNPTLVEDGTAADIDWTTTAASISAHWSGGGDTPGSGIARWEACVSTGASCSGTVLVPWTSTGTTTSGTVPITLTEGERYVVCVRAFDVAGHPSVGSTCSDGQRVDTVPVPAPATVDDGASGADTDVQASTSTITAAWSSIADPAPAVGVASGLTRTQYCVTTTAAGTDCGAGATVPWTDAAPPTGTTMTRSGLSLANGSTYRVCVRSWDLAGVSPAALRCSDGVLVDTGAPTAAWTDWFEPAASPYTHPAGGGQQDLLWYNPAAPAGSWTVRARVTASDPVSGIDRVDFPGLGGAAGWSPAGGGSTSTVSATPVASSYAFDYTLMGGGTIGDPAATTAATAYDTAGNATGAPALSFRIDPDAAAPSGATWSSTPVLQQATTYAATGNVGTDAGSGVASWRIDTRRAELVDGVCGTWGAWVDGTGVPGVSGTATNGQAVSPTIRVDDANADGAPDAPESLCWQTQLHVVDNVGNDLPGPLSGIHQLDFAAPTTTASGPANGSGVVSLGGTASDASSAPAPSFPLTGSGVQDVTVTYVLPDGPDAGSAVDAAGTACTVGTSAGAWTSRTWTCTWSTGALPDGTYTLTAVARDRAGRASAPVTFTVLVDNVAPVASWHSWNVVSGAGSIATTGTVAWVNPIAPTGTYQLDARLTAYDLGSGIDRVDMPAMGAGWTPSGASTATFTSPIPAAEGWTRSYTFTNPASLAAPGVVAARAFDRSGSATDVPFEVRLDGAGPTGAGADVAGGLQSSASVAVALTPGTDGPAGSGLGTWQLQVDRASLSPSGCASFPGTWSDVAGAGGAGAAPAGVAHDVTASGSGCFRYRLRTTDRVGNPTTSAASAAFQRVDLVDPTVALLTPADGSAQSGTVSVTGTAGDAGSGIDHVRLEWLGPDGPDAGTTPDTSGTICDPATLGGSGATRTVTCSWSTGTLPDGTYTVRATSYDAAGRSSATSDRAVVLDNFPPFVGVHSVTETSPYTFWAGPVGTDRTVWFNPGAPAGTYSFDVHVTATDGGVGVGRVEFGGAGTGWTPASTPTTDTAASSTPAPDSYSATYTFDTADLGLADPASVQVQAFDTAGNPGTTTFEIAADAAQPTGSSVGHAVGYVASTNVPVAIDTGTDGAGSGIASWQLHRSDAAIVGGVCTGWSTFAPVAGAGGAGPFVGSRTDVVPDPGCARYELRVTDNVGNVSTAAGPGDVLIDLAPPAASLALSVGANPGAQYLASPTRLFVNTTAAGSFAATVSAAAASGVRDIAFPNLASGFSSPGTVPATGATTSATYSWSAGAGTPAVPSSAVVRSNSLGTTAVPFEVLADPTPPSGSSVSYASGFQTGSSTSVSLVVGSDGAGSGTAGHTLVREQGSLAGGACTWSGVRTVVGGSSPTGPVNDTSLASGSCYRYQLEVTDRVGNVGSSAIGPAIMVDSTPPTSATLTLTESTNPGAQLRTSADTIWVNPTQAGSFTATVTAVDPESGSGSATFPALGSGWTTTPTSDTVAPFGSTFAWGVGASLPAAPTVLVANGAGLTSSIGFAVLLDGDAPTGATLDQQAGFDTDDSIDVAFTSGSDGSGSGIATWTLERRTAPYDGGTATCGTWTAWTPWPAPTGQPASPFVDTAVTQPTCHEYRLVEIDAVGNRTDTLDGDTAVEVDDIFPPAPFTLDVPTNPVLPGITTGGAAPSCGTVPTYGTATPTVTWSASSDAESGLAGYRVHVDGAATPTATVSAPALSWTPASPLAEGPHTIGVRAADVQGNTTEAAPSFPVAVRVDGTPPTAAVTAPAAGAWTGDTTPQLTWSAADANCLARVAVYVDDLLTPVAASAGGETSWTPAAALGQGMHTWKVEAIDAAGNRTSSATSSFGIDTVDPTAFALVTPSAGSTVRGFVDVSWGSSTDAGSGLAPLAAYEVWVDGTLRTTVGAAVTTATIAAISGGTHTVFVRATDAVGNATDTPSASFTGYGPIPAPVLVSPADGAALNAPPSFAWTWPSDGGPAPTAYDVLLDAPTVVAAGVLHPTTTATAGDPGDGLHTWQVEQHDPYTGTRSSTTATFLLDRTPPTNPGPLTITGSTVSWPAAGDPAAPIASGVDRVELWISSGGVDTLVSSLPAGATTGTLGSLIDGVYTVWTRAHDRAGNATDAPSSTVVTDTAPPEPFVLDAPPAPGTPLPAVTSGAADPACLTAPSVGSATPTLTWQPSTDAGSGLAGYDVLVDGLPAGSVGPSTTSFTPGAPLAAGAHSWTVVARDVAGLTRSSTPAPMQIRVDATPPTATLLAPADATFTADATPTLTFTVGDDSCVARVEVSVDGSPVEVLVGSAAAWTPATALADGPHTWSIRAVDSQGRSTASTTRTVTVDTTAPTGITATSPLDAGSVPEGMVPFAWTPGSDGTGAGVSSYDVSLDGAPVAADLAAPAWGPVAVHDGAHTWRVRVVDAVGNAATFDFAFTATVVPDTTTPSPFDLASPADGATLVAGSPFTWTPAFDFEGVTTYRVFIDGALAGAVDGDETSFTAAAGTGSPICSIDFESGPSASCLTSPTYTSGAVDGSTTSLPSPASSSWSTGSAPGFTSSGLAYGIGDPTAPSLTDPTAGFDGDRAWTALEYTAAIPTSGADLRFAHRYRTHMVGDSAYDGGTVEIRVDTAGDGFADDAWASTCTRGTRAEFGTTIDCQHEIVEPDGGYDAVLAGPATNHPLAYRNVFAGDSGHLVQTTMHLSEFSDRSVQVRFRLGTDTCHSDMPAMMLEYCPAGVQRALWWIDDVTLANTSLLPGPHTWKVQAVDAAGNSRDSNQTWTFDLAP